MNFVFHTLSGNHKRLWKLQKETITFSNTSIQVYTYIIDRCAALDRTPVQTNIISAELATIYPLRMGRIFTRATVPHKEEMK